MRTLLLATTSEQKLRELRTIVRKLPCTLLSLRAIQLVMDVEETGTTFAENALLKARAYAHAANALTLADASGLEIEALGGAPGAYLARFARWETAYPERFRMMLARLQGLPLSRRIARFRCAIAPAGNERVVEGPVARCPRREHGFGYDPIFFIPEYDRTLAEMAPEENHRISHRGRAVQAACRLLVDWPIR